MSYWRASAKQEADDLKKIEATFLHKHGYFRGRWVSGTVTWSRNGVKTASISVQSNTFDSKPYIKLSYIQSDRTTDEKSVLDYEIPLVTTSCYFGGVRYWFKCPWHKGSVYCGRRVGVLYLRGKYFACRHCNDLTYNSRNLSCRWKRAGQVISIPELDDLEKSIKRKYYVGKTTRKYKRYLHKELKSIKQMKIMMGKDL